MFSEIYRDILRRMDSSHFWLQTGDDGQKKRGTRYDGQKKRGNDGPKRGAPAKKRGKTQSLERAASSQSARDKSDSRKEGGKAAQSSEWAGSSRSTRKADSRKDDHLETATTIAAPSLETVGISESFTIFKDVKSRLEGSHGRAQRFYGHLKRYIAQQMKKVGQNALLRSDYSKIQDYMNEPVVKELNETNDVVEMDFFDGAITALMVDCEKELPLEA